MNIKYTKSLLNKIEDIIAESDYTLRYEKGNFKSGFCVLKETKIIIINKYFTLEGKINCLVDLLNTLALDTTKMTDKNKKLFSELSQTELKL